MLAALYTAQGLPFGFFTLALPVLMREAGWSLTALGFLQFLAAPWALKFLWAPFVDHHGPRRTWLLSMQLLSSGLALWMAVIGFHEGSIALFVAVFAFNLFAATQDVATDGLAVRLLDAQQRGLANGIQVGAYRFGMVLGGGLLLWLMARTSWELAFVCMAVMLLLLTAPVWRMREPPPHLAGTPQPARVDDPGPGIESVPALLQPAGERPRHALAWLWLHRALRPGVLKLAGLIFVFRFGDQMVSGLITPFLLDQGIDKASLAVMKGAVGSGTSLLGAALGGCLMLRFSRRAALFGSGLLQAGVFGLYLAAALGLGGVPLLWVATVAEGLTSTLVTVALFSLMMDAADPDHPGTDYTLLGSVGVSLASVGSIAGGALGDAFGYPTAFVCGGVLSVVGLLTLIRWLDVRPFSLRVHQAWR